MAFVLQIRICLETKLDPAELEIRFLVEHWFKGRQGTGAGISKRSACRAGPVDEGDLALVHVSCVALIAETSHGLILR